MSNQLQQSLKICYENSRKAIRMPNGIMRDLEHGVLFLPDMELSEEDVALICHFLSGKTACKLIEKLIISPYTFAAPHARKCTPNTTMSYSALCFDKCKLWKSVIGFIEKSGSLKCIVVDSVSFPADLLSSFAQALSQPRLNLQWLGFKNCPLGNRGVRFLSPYLAKLKLQVLAFESCNLTDESLPCISSIIKAHESRMDSLFWNATLRMTDPSAAMNSVGNLEILNQGILALSLSGNQIQGSQLSVLGRALKRNSWLTGINLSSNHIQKDEMFPFLEAMTMNSSLVAILLGGNPGFDCECSDKIEKIVSTNRKAQRIQSYPPHVYKVLDRWIGVQTQHNAVLGISYNSCSTVADSVSNQGVNSSQQCYPLYPNVFDSLESLRCVHLDSLEHAVPVHSNGVLFEENFPSEDGKGYKSDERPPSRISLRPCHSPTSRFGTEITSSMMVESNNNVNNGAQGSSRYESPSFQRRSPSIAAQESTGRFKSSPSTKDTTTPNKKSPPSKRVQSPKRSPSSKMKSPQKSEEQLRANLEHLEHSLTHLRRLYALQKKSQDRRHSSSVSRINSMSASAIPSPEKDLKKMEKSIEAIVALVNHLSSTKMHSPPKKNKDPSDSQSTRMKSRVAKSRVSPSHKESISSSSFDHRVQMDSRNETFFEEFSDIILSATRNLAEVSCQLKNVAESLNESALLHSSMVSSKHDISMNGIPQLTPMKVMEDMDMNADNDNCGMPTSSNHSFSIGSSPLVSRSNAKLVGDIIEAPIRNSENNTNNRGSEPADDYNLEGLIRDRLCIFIKNKISDMML